MSDEQYQVNRFARNLARRLAKLERANRKTARASADLRNSAIDGGQGLVLKDEDGNVAYRLGTDANGVTAPEYVGGPVPAQPAAPFVDAGQRVVKVQLSGLDDDEDPAPTDFWRAEIHVSLDEDFEPSLSTLATYIDEPNGSATHSLPAGEWHVGVVWVTLSKQRSVMSELVVADIEPPVDAEEIEADLEDARQRIKDARDYADQQFEAFDERVESAETDLNDAHDRIDAAEGALSTTQSDLDDAKAGITAAQSDADKAIADALAAAGVAEGKGQIIPQVSAPSGSRARAENFWVRLPDMKVHYYDGDKWKPVLDPDTIAAAQQAANALSKANDLQTKHDALKLAVDGEGGLKDRLSTAENTLEDKADSSALSELDQKLEAIEIPDVSGLASKTELQQGLQDAATDAQTKADAAVTKARETLEAFAHAGDNLIYNGSFEHGWDGWRSPRGEIVEDDDARSGDHVLVLGRETGNDYPMTEYVSAEKGHVYLVEYWAKKLPGGTDPRELRLYTQTLLTDGSTPGAYARNEQGAIALADVADMPENEWVKLSATIEVTHDTATGISFGPHILATGTQFHIDVLRAVDVTEAKAALEAAASAQATADEAHETAGTAQSTAYSALTVAGSKSKVTYSTSAPAGTASAGDTHRQQNESGDIIGEWEYTDDSWQKRQVSSDAISNLDVGKLTAGTTEVAEGVFGKLWADDVAVNNLQAIAGWVGNVLLADGAVTAEKITATREMITKIMGAEWAYISEQLVVEGELIANNADIISAVIKNLDVTEQSNFNDVFAQKLGTKEFTALVATMARAIIAAPNLLENGTLRDGQGWWPSGMSIVEDDTPPGYDRALRWIPGESTGSPLTSPEIPVEPDQDYMFEMWIKADKPNSVFFWDMRDQNADMVGAGDFEYRAVPVEPETGHNPGTRPVSSFIVPTEWTRIRTMLRSKTDVKYWVMRSMYFNHASGSERDATITFGGVKIENMLDGRLTVPGSIDVGSLNVTEEMVASFARILHLVVDQIDVNSLWADTTWQNAGHFGSQDGNYQTRVDGTGLQSIHYDAESELETVMLRIGALFGLIFADENGEITGSLSHEGDASLRDVSMESLTIRGRQLLPTGDPAEYWDGNLWDSQPKGLICFHEEDMAGISVNHTEYGFIEVSHHVRANRKYRVTTNNFLVSNDFSYYGRFRYTIGNNPTAPHTQSPQLGNTWVINSQSNVQIRGDHTFTPETDGLMRILLCVARTGSTPGISFNSGSNYSTTQLRMEDLGPTRPYTGMTRIAGHGGSGTVRDPKPLTGTITTEWAMDWFQNYSHGGTRKRTSHTSTTGYGSGGLTQGQRQDSASSEGIWSSLFGFTTSTASTNPDDQGVTLPAALQGADILSIHLEITNNFAWDRRDQTRYVLWHHNHTSGPNQYSAAAGDLGDHRTQTGNRARIPLSLSQLEALARNGGLTGFGIRNATSTDPLYAGQLSWANPPKLIATYTR